MPNNIYQVRHYKFDDWTCYEDIATTETGVTDAIKQLKAVHDNAIIEVLGQHSVKLYEAVRLEPGDTWFAYHDLTVSMEYAQSKIPEVNSF